MLEFQLEGPHRLRNGTSFAHLLGLFPHQDLLTCLELLIIPPEKTAKWVILLLIKG